MLQALLACMLWQKKWMQAALGHRATSLSVLSTLHAMVAVRGSNCGPLEVQQQLVLLSLRWS
jgi:hypothetical protein